jgi:hypothetical protein
MSNLILDQGATWTRVWTYENPDETPIILNGCVARFQVRYGNASGPIAVDLDSLTKGGIVITNSTGTVTVTVPAATSSALALAGLALGSTRELQSDESYRQASGTLCAWALELTMADGTTVVRLDDGALVITLEVIHA